MDGFEIFKLLMYPIMGIVLAWQARIAYRLDKNQESTVKTKEDIMTRLNSHSKKITEAQTNITNLESDHKSAEVKIDRLNEKIDGLPQKVVDLLRPFLEKR